MAAIRCLVQICSCLAVLAASSSSSQENPFGDLVASVEFEGSKLFKKVQRSLSVTSQGSPTPVTSAVDTSTRNPGHSDKSASPKAEARGAIKDVSSAKSNDEPKNKAAKAKDTSDKNSASSQDVSSAKSNDEPKIKAAKATDTSDKNSASSKDVSSAKSNDEPKNTAAKAKDTSDKSSASSKDKKEAPSADAKSSNKNDAPSGEDVESAKPAKGASIASTGSAEKERLRTAARMAKEDHIIDEAAARVAVRHLEQAHDTAIRKIEAARMKELAKVQEREMMDHAHTSQLRIEHERQQEIATQKAEEEAESAVGKQVDAAVRTRLGQIHDESKAREFRHEDSVARQRSEEIENAQKRKINSMRREVMQSLGSDQLAKQLQEVEHSDSVDRQTASQHAKTCTTCNRVNPGRTCFVGSCPGGNGFLCWQFAPAASFTMCASAEGSPEVAPTAAKPTAIKPSLTEPNVPFVVRISEVMP